MTSTNAFCIETIFEIASIYREGKSKILGEDSLNISKDPNKQNSMDPHQDIAELSSKYSLTSSYLRKSVL